MRAEATPFHSPSSWTQRAHMRLLSGPCSSAISLGRETRPMFGVSRFSGTSTTWRAAETQSAINATRSSLFPKIRHCTVGDHRWPHFVGVGAQEFKAAFYIPFSAPGWDSNPQPTDQQSDSARFESRANQTECAFDQQSC